MEPDNKKPWPQTKEEILKILQTRLTYAQAQFNGAERKRAEADVAASIYREQVAELTDTIKKIQEA